MIENVLLFFKPPLMEKMLLMAGGAKYEKQITHIRQSLMLFCYTLCIASNFVNPTLYSLPEQ